MSSAETAMNDEELKANGENPAAGAVVEDPVPEPKVKLTLEVQVNQPSTCERHVVVTVSREDIDRYFADSFKELLPKASVAGFRSGKAPKGLVEKQFKEQVSDQVKGKLLMDSMAQISEEYDFSAISEPEFDVKAITLPSTGPLKFEFKLEVRPEFDLPAWEGLSLERPVHEYNDVDIDRNLKHLLEKYGTLAPVEESAQLEDYVIVNATFSVEGNLINTLTEQSIQLRKILSFSDAKIEDFAGEMLGAKSGDKKTFTINVSQDAESEVIRGKAVQAEFEVLDVKRMVPPSLNHQFLDRIGGFEDEDELRDEVRKELERQLEYHQRNELRKQITAKLTAAAKWDLPPHLLRRQFSRELDRSVMELQAAGFDKHTIQMHANQLRQNSLKHTEMVLKEHFILERIAEQNSFEAEPADYDKEIKLIAAQSGESVRRVRARMERKGQLDTLRNQIVEGKVIDLITGAATIKEVPLVIPVNETTAIDIAIGRVVEKAIPEASAGNEEKSIPGMPVDKRNKTEN